MLRTLTTIVLALAWPLPAMALSADTKIGMLSCTLSEPRDALTPDGASAERARDAICAFSSESGEHETYTGKITGVSITPQGQSTLIWVVRSPSEGPVRPGALQRTVAKRWIDLIRHLDEQERQQPAASATERSGLAPRK